VVAVNRDVLGLRGEALFESLILRSHPTQGLFRPQFLGDKWPAADFIVELEGVEEIRPFFMVQARATAEGYTQREKRLKVKCSQQAISALASYPLPTYLVGIDVQGETGYIVSVNGEQSASLASMTTAYPLHMENMLHLHREVQRYWQNAQRPIIRSLFTDINWR
jgi:hypothetical protein